MNATGILFLIVGAFLVINAGNILQVYQGKATIGISTGSRSTPTATTSTPATTAKGAAGG